MPKAIFISSTGAAEVEVPIGSSLMLAATRENIDCILGECGGAMSCATCHVFVEPEFLALLAPAGPTEAQMLDFTATPRQENSRLSCQLIMTEALDGLTVHVPAQ